MTSHSPFSRRRLPALLGSLPLAATGLIAAAPPAHATPTADGLKVAQQYREPGIPMICLETALPAKFAESIVEATGQQPPVPEALADLEHRVQRYVRMPADAALLKAYVAART